MTEKKNIIQEVIEEVAKRRAVSNKEIVNEMLESLEKLRQSGIGGADQSADEHEKLIKGTKKK